jgi:hypothetical protein
MNFQIIHRTKALSQEALVSPSILLNSVPHVIQYFHVAKLHTKARKKNILGINGEITNQIVRVLLRTSMLTLKMHLDNNVLTTYLLDLE